MHECCYWVVSCEPRRYPQIVVIGFLGKVLGPIGWGFSVKLMLMRWRMGHLWAVAACAAFVCVLTFGCNPDVPAGAAAGMSAPSTPRASIESAPVAKFLQSHFDWSGHALASASLSLVLSSVRAGIVVRRHASAGSPNYGPLHRRPPPSFS